MMLGKAGSDGVGSRGVSVGDGGYSVGGGGVGCGGGGGSGEGGSGGGEGGALEKRVVARANELGELLLRRGVGMIRKGVA